MKNCMFIVLNIKTRKVTKTFYDYYDASDYIQQHQEGKFAIITVGFDEYNCINQCDCCTY